MEVRRWIRRNKGHAGLSLGDRKELTKDDKR
jgi:hypothetical protein